MKVPFNSKYEHAAVDVVARIMIMENRKKRLCMAK